MFRDVDFKGDLEKQKKNGALLQKIANIQAVGIRDDLAELWAVKYWKQFVEEKQPFRSCPKGENNSRQTCLFGWCF